MLDVNYLKNHKKEIINRLEKRGNNYRKEIEEIIRLNDKRKKRLLKLEQYREVKNSFTLKFAKIKRKLNEDPIKKVVLNSDLKEIQKKLYKLKTEAKKINSELEDINKKLIDKNSYLPNIPSIDTPFGLDDSENVEIKKVNSELISQKNVAPHWEIAEKLGWISPELGAKLSGSRFLVYSGLGSKMIRVLADILLDFHTKNGYTEYNVPLIVNKSAMEGTGQLPKFEEDAYRTGDQYLIPTGEVPLTNFVANDLLDYKQLPLNLTAFTPCFRQEAGAAGKDTKGMIRLHQFNKVELVKIIDNKTGDEEFKNLVNEVEGALNLFDLPYRIVNLVSGDLGFSSMKTYDFEIWLPHQKKYLEISSCSFCGDFQARNMKARYRDENGKTHFVNTLNGSGVAVDRLFAAILENYWDGEKLKLPKILRPYFENQKYLK